ncbi:MAG: hypothetical protein ABIL62_17085 [Planctomycetota bacterium]
MKNKGTINAGYNQFRWVVLLLAIAVILPTVCLLWFMSRAVKNERLAVRQTRRGNRHPARTAISVENA